MNRINRILTAFVVTLFCGITMNLSAENRFFIEDFSIEPGETKDVEIILENDVDFAAFQADIILPSGLEFVDLRTQTEINKNKPAYYFKLTDRADDHSISSAEIDANPQHRRIISSSGNNWTYYTAEDAETAALVTFKVKAVNGFADSQISIFDIIFTQANETQYNFENSVANVSLKKYYVESISLDATSLTLNPAESATLTATVLPETATDRTINWSSSNSAVATVDSNGTVTAVASGNAIITALAADGSGVKAVCEVTVVAMVNRFFIEDFSIEAGETKTVEIILENSVDFAAFQADIILPSGLEFADLRTQAEINKNKAAYYFKLTDRADDHSISSAEIDANPQHRRIISSSGNNWTYYSAEDAGTAALVTFKVKASSKFIGTATISIFDIIFTQADETQYDLESTLTTVTGPEWEEPTGVELTVVSPLHGSLIFFVESGKAQSIKLIPDEGYALHTLSFNGTDVKEDIIEGYYTTPALTAPATLNVAFEIVVGADEVVASDRVRVTANGGRIIVDGTVYGELVNLYTDSGMQVNSVYSNGDRIEFEAMEGKVYIVKTLNRTVKVMM